MGIIRSNVTKHTSCLDLEYRVGVHNPTGPSADGEEKKAVVEVYHRDYSGEIKLIGTYWMQDFIEMNRDIVRIGKEILGEHVVEDVVD